MAAPASVIEAEDDVPRSTSTAVSSSALIERARASIVGMLIVLSKASASPTSLMVVSMLISFFQVLAFAFHSEAKFPWSDTYTHTFSSIMNFFRFSETLLNNIPGYTLYGGCMAVVVFVLANAGYVAHGIDKQSFQHIWLLKLLRATASFVTTVLYIPILGVLFAVITCASPSSLAREELTCWAGWHIPLDAIAAIAVLLFVVFSLVVVGTVFDDKPNGANKGARSHSRVTVADAVAKTVLSGMFSLLANRSVKGSQSLSEWILVVTVLVCTNSLLYVHAYYLPFYSTFTNTLQAVMYAIQAWSGWALLLCKILDDDAHPGAALTFWYGVPLVVGLAVLIVHARQQSITLRAVSFLSLQSAINDEAANSGGRAAVLDTAPKVWTHVFEVDLAVRLLIARYKRTNPFFAGIDNSKQHTATSAGSFGGDDKSPRRVQDDRIVQQANMLLVAALKQFPESARLHFIRAQFAFAYTTNLHLIMRYLNKAAALKPDVVLQFSIQSYLNLIGERLVGSSSSRSVIEYVQVEQFRKSALAHDELASEAHADFWAELNGQRPAPEKLKELSFTMTKLTMMASKDYDSLIALMGDSVQALDLRRAANFHLELGNDPSKAALLFNRARSKEMRRRGHGARGALNMHDPQNPIIVINGADARLGEIVRVNGAACEAFGYRREEFLGGNVNMIVPRPFREHHDGYLLRYLDVGSGQNIGKVISLPGVHRNGFIMPLDLKIEQYASTDGAVSFLAVLRVDRDAAYEMAIVDAEFNVLERSHRIDEFFGGGTHVTDWLPCWEEQLAEIRGSGIVVPVPRMPGLTAHISSSVRAVSSVDPSLIDIVKIVVGDESRGDDSRSRASASGDLASNGCPVLAPSARGRKTVRVAVSPQYAMVPARSERSVDGDGGRSVSNMSGTTSRTSGRSERSAVYKLNAAIEVMNHEAKRILSRFKIIILASLALVAVDAVVFFFLIDKQYASYESDVALVSFIGRQRYSTVRICFLTQWLVLIAQGVSSPADLPYVTSIIAHEVEQMHFAQSQLAAVSAVNDVLGENDVLIYKLAAGGVLRSTPTPLPDAVSAFIARAASVRSEAIADISSMTVTNADVFFMLANGDGSILAAFNHSTISYSHRLMEDAADMKVLGQILMGATQAVIFMVLLFVVRPSVSRIEDNNSYVIRIFINFPRAVVRQVSSVFQARLAAFREEDDEVAPEDPGSPIGGERRQSVLGGGSPRVSRNASTAPKARIAAKTRRSKASGRTESGKPSAATKQRWSLGTCYETITATKYRLFLKVSCVYILYAIYFAIYYVVALEGFSSDIVRIVDDTQWTAYQRMLGIEQIYLVRSLAASTLPEFDQTSFPLQQLSTARARDRLSYPFLEEQRTPGLLVSYAYAVARFDEAEDLQAALLFGDDHWGLRGVQDQDVAADMQHLHDIYYTSACESFRASGVDKYSACLAFDNTVLATGFAGAYSANLDRIRDVATLIHRQITGGAFSVPANEGLLPIALAPTSAAREPVDGATMTPPPVTAVASTTALRFTRLVLSNDEWRTAEDMERDWQLSIVVSVVKGYLAVLDETMNEFKRVSTVMISVIIASLFVVFVVLFIPLFRHLGVQIAQTYSLLRTIPQSVLQEIPSLDLLLLQKGSGTESRNNAEKSAPLRDVVVREEDDGGGDRANAAQAPQIEEITGTPSTSWQDSTGGLTAAQLAANKTLFDGSADDDDESPPFLWGVKQSADTPTFSNISLGRNAAAGDITSPMAAVPAVVSSDEGDE